MLKRTIPLFIIAFFINGWAGAQPPSFHVIDKAFNYKYIVPVQYYQNDNSDTGKMNALNVTNGYHNEGLSALLIDKKVPSRAETPFDFLHINLTTKVVTRVPVIKGNSLDSAQTKTGQLRGYAWSHNKKLYVGTHEPSHLISFDPYNNVAHDYGNPFKNGFSMNTFITNGKDSAIYGVSERGRNGYIYVFRLDHIADTIRVDSIYAPDASMGIAVYGDARYTYVITGRNGSQVFSLDRQTNPPTVTELLSAPTAETFAWHSLGIRDDTTTFLYYDSHAYMFENGGVTMVPAIKWQDYPKNQQPCPVPLNTSNYPLIGFNPLTDSVFWKFRNSSVEDGLKITPTVTEMPFGPILQYKPNHIVGWGSLYSLSYKYPIADDSIIIQYPTGSIYGADTRNGKLYTAEYSGGVIREFNPDLPVNTFSRSFIDLPVAENASNANPRKIASVSGGGTGLGPQVVSGFGFINDTLMSFSGNVNSDGKRLGQGTGMGTVNLTGQIQRVTDTLLKYYGDGNSVLGDNGFVYHVGLTDEGHQGGFMKQNIAENRLEKIVPFYSEDPGRLLKGITNQIIGWKQMPNYPPNVLIYFLSEVSDEIYKQVNFPKRVHAMRLGYDNNLWILSSGSDSTYLFYKMDPKTGSYEPVFEFMPPAPPQPTYFGHPYNDFIFVGGDVYLSGSWRLARIQNLAPPVSNSYLSNYEKLNGKLNFQKCD
jgi:hypothetical protein